MREMSKAETDEEEDDEDDAVLNRLDMMSSGSRASWQEQEDPEAADMH